MDSRPAEGRTAELEARIESLERELATRSDRQRGASPLAERALRYVPLLAIGHLFVGVPAVAISLGVAYFAFVQAEATDKMQVASVWPRVTYVTSNQNDEGQAVITLSMINKGVGPAIIRGVRVRNRGKDYTGFRELLDDCCNPGHDRLSIGVGSINGEVLRPGEEMMFALFDRRSNPPEAYARFNRERLGLQVSTCYCSVFDDCWIDSGSEPDPRPVDRCPANWVQYTGFPQAPPDNP